MTTCVSSTIPKTLSIALREQTVLPFVGAGVSRAVCFKRTGRPLFPTWPELLSSAADKLEDEGKTSRAKVIRALLEDNPIDYPDIANRVVDGLGKTIFARFLKAQFDKDLHCVDAESLTLARTIWQLGSKVVITTNYDNVLEWVCPDQCERWDVQSTFEQWLSLHSEVSRSTVWHLHGYIGNIGGMVLTTPQYEELYNSINFKSTLSTLHQYITKQNLLFIGFSLNDPYVKRILCQSAETFSHFSGPHFILLKQEEADRFDEKILPGILPITFKTYDDLPAIVGEMANIVINRKEDEQYEDTDLALMFHELLTPITCIRGWVDLALDKDDPVLIRRALEVIHRNALRQDHILKELFDISRAERGKLILENEQTDLWVLTTQAVEELHHQESGVSLSLNRFPVPLPIIADSVRILGIIKSILTDAVKYTAGGRVITISGRIEAHMAIIDVSGIGCGIPKDVLEDIFVQSGEGQINGKDVGKSRSMILVKHIVKLHEGRVTVSMDKPDNGFTITIMLPLADNQSDAPPCSNCGEIMVRSGSCYKCLNCGSTSGCS